MERWQSGRMRALGERVIARSQGSNPCLSASFLGEPFRLKGRTFELLICNKVDGRLYL